MRSDFSIIIGWLCLILLAYISVDVKYILSFPHIREQTLDV
jgi:hypothetical protein